MNTSPSNCAKAKSAAIAASLFSAFAFLSLVVHARPTAESKSESASTSESATPALTPTFYRDVAPILQQHCENCHRADGIAPMALQTYSEAKSYGAAIAASTKSRSMPPWFAVPNIGHFSNDPSLTPQQIAMLSAWSAAGAPAGDSKDAPPPIHWSESWTIAQPDQIFPMTRGVAIPKDGDVDYTYEIVPTHFNEDRWIQSVEVLPSLRANVHHSVVYVRPPHAHWLEHAPVGVPFTADDLTDPEDRRGAQLDGRRCSARVCARQLTRRIPSDDGKVHPRRLGPRVPDALHHKRPRRHRHNAGRNALRKNAAAQAGSDAPTHQRSFRDPARRARLSRRSARHAPQRCAAPQPLSPHAPARQAFRIQHRAPKQRRIESQCRRRSGR